MKHAGYGKLSGRDLEQQQDNAAGRVASEEEARKQHPFDFALWKGTKPGEPSFPSPWGAGRPGWHIECSAMVREELGDTIDIHLGGADLVFPHHENEIAQSEAATGKELAHYWLHNGMVNVGGQKMSKSLGNFTTIRALLDSGVSPMTLRLFTLQAHYRPRRRGHRLEGPQRRPGPGRRDRYRVHRAAPCPRRFPRALRRRHGRRPQHLRRPGSAVRAGQAAAGPRQPDRTGRRRSPRRSHNS
jgi:hypothetical protein